jgi:L-ornithine Nalpha-acyltransferase
VSYPVTNRQNIPAMKSPELSHLALNSLFLKVAKTSEEVIAAQKLRYKVFYEEMGANPTEEMRHLQQEIEAYDPYCDHLLVIDTDADPQDNIVGTYRILTQDQADRSGMGFYTETEFDLSKLKSTNKKIMEVSRSCVLESYRSKMVINLLWRGIMAYVFHYGIDYLIGVASFQGTDVSEHNSTLAFLNQFYMADETILPKTLPQAYVPFPTTLTAENAVRQEFMKLPPLLKGYLRVGAKIGNGAFIDHQFNTIDVAIVVPMESFDQKYMNNFKRGDV